MKHEHYWRRMFAEVYVLLGLLGFLLTTQTIAEIIARVLFIIMGVVLWHLDRKKSIYLLIMGASLTIGWIFYAMGVIINHWADPAYRFHVVSLPLWWMFLRLHYRAIRGLSSGE